MLIAPASASILISVSRSPGSDDIWAVRVTTTVTRAASIACIELVKAMGMPHENAILCDTKGVIYQGRTEGMNQWKSAHAVRTKARTLEEAMKGADVFFGLSVKGALTQDMVRRMADRGLAPEIELTRAEKAEKSLAAEAARTAEREASLVREREQLLERRLVQAHHRVGRHRHLRVAKYAQGTGRQLVVDRVDHEHAIRRADAVEQIHALRAAVDQLHVRRERVAPLQRLDAAHAEALTVRPSGLRIKWCSVPWLPWNRLAG